MAIAIDATTPASFSNATTLSITSPSFTPPAGALLLLMYGTNNSSTADSSVASVTNTGTATTWTRRARKNTNAASTGGTAGTNGGAEMWTAVAPGGAITVTVTGVGTGSTGFDKFGRIMVLTGADTTNLANAAGASSTSGLPSVTVPSNVVGSYVFAMSTDWLQKGLGTAGTGQTIIDEYNQSGQISMHAWRTTATLAAAGSQVMNLTLPTGEQYNLVGMEVRAGAVAASNPLPPRVMRNPTMRAAVI